MVNKMTRHRLTSTQPTEFMKAEAAVTRSLGKMKAKTRGIWKTHRNYKMIPLNKMIC